MHRLVLQLFSSAGQNGERHVEFAVVDPPLFDSPTHPLTITATEAEFEALKQASLSGEAVKLAGQKLFDALARHPDVAEQLTAALQARPDEHCPVFLQIKTSAGVEDLPWEALCSPRGDFLALDQRWGLGRAVESITAAPPRYDFTPPLRIAAILSCLGVKAAGELAALREAIATAPGLRTRLLLITSEEELYASIAQEAAPDIDVRFVPADLRSLQEMVQEFEPDVLHFFCHGTTASDPHLLLAVKSDWIRGTPDKSLALGAKEFRKFARETGPTPWLLVLNACESAAMATQDNVQSLASRLLYYGAAPAVVGMREPVLSGDANLITAVFYRRLLSDLQCRLFGTPGGDDVEDTVAWVVRLVVEARNQLALRDPAMTLDMAAASTKEWTLPVAYVSARPFQLRVQPPSPPTAPARPEPAVLARIRLELEALRQLTATLPPDTHAGPLRDDAVARMRELEKQLEEP